MKYLSSPSHHRRSTSARAQNDLTVWRVENNFLSSFAANSAPFAGFLTAKGACFAACRLASFPQQRCCDVVPKLQNLKNWAVLSALHRSAEQPHCSAEARATRLFSKLNLISNLSGERASKTAIARVSFSFPHRARCDTGIPCGCCGGCGCSDPGTRAEGCAFLACLPACRIQ